MKKIIAISLFILSISSLFAGEKSTVYVENFTASDGIDKAHVQALRAKIMETIISKNRVIVKDVNAEASLQKQKDKSPEASLAKIKELHADFVIQGHITTMSIAKVENTANSKVKYEGTIAYSMNIIDVKTGATKASISYSYPTGSVIKRNNGETPDQAIINTMAEVDNDIDKFVDQYFEITGSILDVFKENNGKVQEVYISLGSKDGIQKGQKFELFVERNIAGRIAESKIGELQAEAVEGEDISLCKVNGSKTQEELKSAMTKGDKIIIKSTAKKDNLLDKSGIKFW